MGIYLFIRRMNILNLMQAESVYGTNFTSCNTEHVYDTCGEIREHQDHLCNASWVVDSGNSNLKRNCLWDVPSKTCKEDVFCVEEFVCADANYVVTCNDLGEDLCNASWTRPLTNDGSNDYRCRYEFGSCQFDDNILCEVYSTSTSSTSTTTTTTTTDTDGSRGLITAIVSMIAILAMY